MLLAVLFLATGLLRHEAHTPTAATRPKGPAPAVTASDADKTIGVALDLDGDGRSDEVTLQPSGIPNGDSDDQWAVEATLANGPTPAGLMLLGDNVAAWPVNISDDRRQQLLVRTGGNTWTTGSLLVLADGRLQLAMTADTKLNDFGWSAHSNCCPGATADVACNVDGAEQRGLVITESELVGPEWDGHYPPPLPSDPFALYSARPHRRPWQRTVYRLGGATLTPIAHDQGVLVGDEASPPGVPLNNALACGVARD